MDRFIGVCQVFSNGHAQPLKSNMDRFIDILGFTNEQKTSL